MRLAAFKIGIPQQRQSSAATLQLLRGEFLSDGKSNVILYLHSLVGSTAKQQRACMQLIQLHAGLSLLRLYAFARPENGMQVLLESSWRSLMLDLS